jgi:hypothetical protein
MLIVGHTCRTPSGRPSSPRLGLGIVSSVPTKAASPKHLHDAERSSSGLVYHGIRIRSRGLLSSYGVSTSLPFHIVLLLVQFSSTDAYLLFN